MTRRWFALVCVVSGCQPVADPRPQWLLYIDTNLAAVDEQFERPDVTAAAIDTVRIDVLTKGSEDIREYTILRANEWPLSVGILPASAPQLLWIRAFHSRDATEEIVDGERFSLPHASVTVARLVELDGVPVGVEPRLVMLDGDCLNRPVQFGSEPLSCVDRARISQAADVGIASVIERPPTQVGSWSALLRPTCGAAPPGDVVCVPGGFSVLGERSMVGLVSSTLYVEPTPLRPIVVSPFWMDRTEMTVQRFRQLVRAGAITEALPKLPSADPPLDVYCTWLGADNDANDALALNCVSRRTAEQACAADGGRLPSEAEWEHAARGTGRQLLFPWGDETPACCQVSANRGSLCPGGGVSPVGAYADGCDGSGDRTVDGIVDMAGNVNEFVGGALRPYDDLCWGGFGVSADPMCIAAAGDDVGVRGGDFGSGIALTSVVLRTTDIAQANPASGFRCVYGGAG